MHKMMSAAICLTLLGCASSGNAPSAPPSIQTVKGWILQSKSRIFIDPDSARDGMIGQPYVSFTGMVGVCIGANSRNQLGGFTGYRYSILMFTQAGQFALAQQPNIYDTGSCQEAAMTPFPELSGGAGPFVIRQQ